MFELVLVVEHRIVGGTVHPHAIDNFDPALGQATQAVRVSTAFVAMMAVVDLSPYASAEGMFCKEVQGVAQVGVRSPSLVARPALRIGFSFSFPSAYCHRRCARKALQSFSALIKASAIIAVSPSTAWA